MPQNYFLNLNYIHLFREGNGPVQRLFFYKLVEEANHKLDFFLVTNKRMTSTCIAAMGCDDFKPTQHMFEDISNPYKIDLFKKCIIHIDKYCLIAAKEGLTYTGIYRGTGWEGFFIKTDDNIVACKREEITPELLKTLKKGDPITFTALPIHNILIPKE
ncbi:hypothetical protein [Bartonella ancashensis]|uniref:BepA intracellular delivery domain-containing protein n=1 Tax=Bartonella ancashensis TaxID=1318743 RepID=A0A0M4LRV2_9HYPH|nr:hypothetical protein [Bartonella ancashensis]ALE03022.1 hypothetical protein PU02_0208 [Bartonella ancashensis]ARE31028.1 cell filamentation protein [Bartonella ancashensis]